ncbi:unnamed protein product [Bursaphelenchus xylophilus]|uniref:(pine wood nematode) hypothetical protein n=1 Tax=Bursaphelenchus xylophilus TaxID=6326 RepID=A0A1I7RU81_BURXY|nr:unnamed protein product [Bursaphelenchus xylophilus]CAG9113909.1 unnamed protein product [Bursaphelenchus xylophilus]
MAVNSNSVADEIASTVAELKQVEEDLRQRRENIIKYHADFEEISQLPPWEVKDRLLELKLEQIQGTKTRIAQLEYSKRSLEEIERLLRIKLRDL